MNVKRTHGFTMIEMAVALAVIGILMAAVMPSIGEWMSNARVRTAADSLQGGLQAARNEAVKRNRTVTFWLVSLADDKLMDDSCKLSSTSGSWVVSINSPEGKCSTEASSTNDPMLVVARAAGDGGSGVDVTAKTADKSKGADSVTFNGFGQIAGADGIGNVDVSSTSASRGLRIVVSNNGSIFMCDPHVVEDKDPRHCPN